MTDQPNRSELRKAAEAAQRMFFGDKWDEGVWARFKNCATTNVTISMLDEIDELRRKLAERDRFAVGALAELETIQSMVNGRSWGYYGSYRGVEVTFSEDHIQRINMLLLPAPPEVPKPEPAKEEKN